MNIIQRNYPCSDLEPTRYAKGERAPTPLVSPHTGVLALLIIFFLLFTSIELCAQGTAFFPKASTSVAFSPGRIVTGDFNRDGKTDIATLHRGRSEISLLPGNGDGTLGTVQVLATTTNPVDIYLNEFSNDAREDMAAVGPTIGLSRGNGAGSFGSFARTELGVEVFTSTIGDFNEDGRTDLITITGAGLRLFTSTGVRLNALGSPIPALSAATSIVAGDFNRDGHRDVAFTRFGQSTSIGVMFGNGNGTFQPMAAFVTGETPLDIMAADFNRDGHLDLAVSSLSATRPLAILLNDRSGGFQLPLHPLGAKADQFATADMDHNGTMDVVIMSRTLRRIEILRGNGDGTFAAAELAVTLTLPTIGDFALAQLDGDVFPDLAVSGRDQLDPNLGQVATFLNPGKGPTAEGLVNISTHLLIENGSRVITGFVVEGKPTKVLIRSVGPGLRQFGITNVIADTSLSVFRGNTRIALNDNWSATAANRAAVEQANTAAGAFPLTVGSLDAAIVLTLIPGDYTIVTATPAGASGEVLVEVYNAN